MMSRRDELVFAPLGGVGEIGMNMSLYGFGPERDRRWLVVDCGVTFAGPNLPGIDLIMPDTQFLEDEADRILGLVLTHAHEDHYGAVLDLWPMFDKPVYATRFAAAMLQAKRIANRITEEVAVTEVVPGTPFEIGPFKLEAISMAHSIPESTSLLIETPAGRVLHTGDWKLDPTPVGCRPTDVERLQEIGADPRPLALVCDSTNALKDGSSPSETEVGEKLADLIASAPHRVAVTIFASNLGRMISIAKAAAKCGRDVVLSGRALHRVAGIAQELGLLEGVPTLHDQEVFRELPRRKVVVICTGSQGEANAAIARIARGEHPVIELDRGDRMIFSSWAIPGNEREVIDIQNRFIDQGVEIITNSDHLVHVTGHPRREELVRLYDWVKPKILVPVHGEAAHLTAHAELGREHGVPNVFSPRNGDLLRLFPDAELHKNEIPAGELYLDGDILCTPEESGVRGRRRLSFGGMIAVSLCVDGRGQIVAGPEITIEGLPDIDEEDESIDLIVERAIKGILRSMPAKRRGDAETLREALRRGVRGEVNAYWGRKPNVHIFVHKVT